jgi:hypothetical protein
VSHTCLSSSLIPNVNPSWPFTNNRCCVVMIFSYGNNPHKLDGFFKNHLQNVTPIVWTHYWVISHHGLKDDHFMIHFHLWQSLNTNTHTQQTHVIAQGKEKKTKMNNAIPFQCCLDFVCASMDLKDGAH